MFIQFLDPAVAKAKALGYQPVEDELKSCISMVCNGFEGIFYGRCQWFLMDFRWRRFSVLFFFFNSVFLWFFHGIPIGFLVGSELRGFGDQRALLPLSGALFRPWQHLALGGRRAIHALLPVGQEQA